jgi:hypothetical protein
MEKLITKMIVLVMEINVVAFEIHAMWSVCPSGGLPVN